MIAAARLGKPVDLAQVPPALTVSRKTRLRKSPKQIREEEICDLCWNEQHKQHTIELIAVARTNKLQAHWQKRQLNELRHFCLENVEIINRAVDLLGERRQRYLNLADITQSLIQKEQQIEQDFQIQQPYGNSDGIAEFERHLNHAKAESIQQADDMIRLNQVFEELKQITKQTAEELNKRTGAQLLL